MDITVTDVSAVKKQFKIVVGAEEIKKQKKLVEKEYLKGASIPGFRPGKAPVEMIYSRYGKEIEHQVKQNLIRHGAISAIEDKNFFPLGDPIVEQVDPMTDESFGFTFSIEIKPEIDLTDYKKVEVTKTKYIVSEENIQRVLNRLAEENAVLHPRKEGEAVQATDIIETAINYIYDGKPSEEPRDEKIPVEFFSKMTKGLSEKIVGLKVGDMARHVIEEDKEEKVPKVEMEIPIKSIFYKELPTINDEFAATVGQAASLEEFKGKIRETLEGDLEKRSRAALLSEIMKVILEKNPFPVPEVLINRQLNAMINYDENSGSYYYRVGGAPKATKELKTARNELYEEAETIVKQVLLMDAVANKEEITVEESELDKHIENYAKANKLNINKAKAQLRNSGELDEMRFILRNQKVREFLLDNAEVKVVEVSEEDLYKREGGSHDHDHECGPDCDHGSDNEAPQEGKEETPAAESEKPEEK